MEGGAVVLTLKDQHILADGDINEGKSSWYLLLHLPVSISLNDWTLLQQNFLSGVTDADMLENIEIGEQKRRDEAYKAAKKKTGIYDDK